MREIGDIFAAAIDAGRSHPLMLLCMLALLAASAMFSGCETAFFSLTAPELNRFRSGKGALDRIITSLHSDLRRLLPTILFGNMMVNVMLYALSATLASELGRRHGGAAAFAFGLASLLVVLFFGEVFPKQAAIAVRLSVVKATAIPIWFIHRALSRPLAVLNAVVTAIERILVGTGTHAGVREEELRLLVETSRTDGVISDSEFELIDGVVDLPEVRLRDVMVPRVDLVSLERGASPADVVALAHNRKHCKLPVLDSALDDFVGWVDAREVFSEAGESVGLEPFVRKFRYFSEHDRADQILAAIRRGGDSLMAVVDERGAIIGMFTRQDILDELLGHFGDFGSAPPESVREKDGGYIFAGGVSIRELRDLFGVKDEGPKSATVGGLVVALLGRAPKHGDKVVFGGLDLMVLSCRRRRVTEVLVKAVSIRRSAAEGGGT